MIIPLEHNIVPRQREKDFNTSKETFIPKINSKGAKEEIIAIKMQAKLIVVNAYQTRVIFKIRAIMHFARSSSYSTILFTSLYTKTF